MRLEYTTNHNDINYGAVINVNGGYRNYALFCNGGLRLNGAISTARYVRPGAKTNAIINDIGYNTPLVNENGDSITLDMRKGDCATFAYINQTWYLFNKNF